MKYVIITQAIIIFVLLVVIVYQKTKYANEYDDLFFDYQQTHIDYKDERTLREVERVVNGEIYETKLRAKDEQIARLNKILHASESKRKELCERLNMAKEENEACKGGAFNYEQA